MGTEFRGYANSTAPAHCLISSIDLNKVQESLSRANFEFWFLCFAKYSQKCFIKYVTIYAQLKTRKLQNFKKQKIYLKYLTPGANVIICERFTKIRQLFFAGVGGNITAY